MGLDSVELVCAWEKYFDIEISNLEAEKIVTVQNAVDCIAMYLNITEDNTFLKDSISHELQKELINLEIIKDALNINNLIYEMVTEDNLEKWGQLSNNLKLEVLLPTLNLKGSGIKQLFSKIWEPQYDYKTITIDQLIDVICSANIDKLVASQNIKSKYEIYIAIMAITVDRIGIDYYEFKKDKTFVKDFGID